MTDLPRFSVRHGSANDIGALADFNICMALETESLKLKPEVITAGVRGMVERPERGFYLVVECHDTDSPGIVASLMVTTEWSDWRNGLFWWIQSVYVLPDYRRMGLYRRLYDHVRNLAATEPEVCGFRLYVEKDNTRAQATYSTLGMVETDYRLYEQLATTDFQE